MLSTSVFLTSSCNLSSQKLELEKGDAAAEAGDFNRALEHYDRVVKRHQKTETALVSAEKAGRIAFYETKDYKRAIEYYRHIVVYSPNAASRMDAQKKIAVLLYEHLQDYKSAIVEYARLLELPHDPSEGLHYRLAIARSYFYLNNFFQALVEVDALLGRSYEKRDLFDAYELKANILLQTKRLEEAVDVLKQLTREYPVQAKERQIGLVLAVCYEEMKDFTKAIETLDSIKETYPSKEFIEGRIKKLKERQSYLPGAKGLRK